MPYGESGSLSFIDSFISFRWYFPKAYFTACLEDGIQEFALQELYVILNPPMPVVQPPPARSRNFTEPHLSGPETTIVESPTSKAKSLPETSLAPHDIARYLGETTKSTLGDWPVMVSQRGIKHLRQYSARDRNTFSRIEKIIRLD